MLVRRVETSGGKYAIELHQDTETLFSVRGFTGGVERSASTGWPTLTDATARFDRAIDGAKMYDNRTFHRVA